jgi:hypothetical protein
MSMCWNAAVSEDHAASIFRAKLEAARLESSWPGKSHLCVKLFVENKLTLNLKLKLLAYLKTIFES